MKLQLTNSTKIFLICTCSALSFLGFLVKLPTSFRYFDKELHTIFYFSAAAFFNIIFSNKKYVGHIVIFSSLFLFGVFIEFAQGYSNKIFHRRIHGRFDTQDIQSNLKGLIAFTILWILCVTILFVYSKRTINEAKPQGE